MRRSTKMTLMSIPAVLAIAPLAMAQEIQPKPLSIRLGVNYLTDSTSRDFSKYAGYILGLGFQLPSTSLLNPEIGEASVECDFLRHAGNGNRLDSFDLMYAERVPFSTDGTAPGSPTMYAGLGVGLALNSGKMAGQTGGSSGVGLTSLNPGESFTTWTLAAKVMLGVKIGDAGFFEASYRLAGAAEGYKTDGFSLMVGVRF